MLSRLKIKFKILGLTLGILTGFILRDEYNYSNGNK